MSAPIGATTGSACRVEFLPKLAELSRHLAALLGALCFLGALGFSTLFLFSAPRRLVGEFVSSSRFVSLPILVGSCRHLAALLGALCWLRDLGFLTLFLFSAPRRLGGEFVSSASSSAPSVAPRLTFWPCLTRCPKL